MDSPSTKTHGRGALSHGGGDLSVPADCPCRSISSTGRLSLGGIGAKGGAHDAAVNFLYTPPETVAVECAATHFHCEMAILFCLHAPDHHTCGTN